MFRSSSRDALLSAGRDPDLPVEVTLFALKSSLHETSDDYKERYFFDMGFVMDFRMCQRVHIFYQRRFYPVFSEIEPTVKRL